MEARAGAPASPQTPSGGSSENAENHGLPVRAGGRINKDTNSRFVGHGKYAVARNTATPHVPGRHSYILPPAAVQQDALNPKP